jgi:uncharacterized protein
MIAYFDTSALIKLIIPEDGSDQARLLWDQAGEVVLSRLAWPESTAALAAARRAHRLTEEDHATATRLIHECFDRATKISVIDGLVDHGADLASAYALRAADAIHLATALAVAEADSVFVAWDKRLRQAAVQAGVVASPAQDTDLVSTQVGMPGDDQS